MAVSSVSSSSASSIYGSRNSNIISGLASGMDTESMIEGMVMGTKNKIDKQKQEQQMLQWQQSAYRSISDQLVQISNKYTSYTSSTNLMSSSFFNPSIITSLGSNADMISASGSTTSNIEIGAVGNLATTETITFKGLSGVDVSNTVSGSKGINFGTDAKVNISNIAGKQLSFEYGNKSFSITFDSNRKYNSLDDVVDEINRQLSNASITTSSGSTIKMSDKIKAENVDNKLQFSFTGSDSNTLEIKSYSSSEVLKALHLSAGDKLTSSSEIKSSAEVTSDDLFSEKSVADALAGTSMTVSYNGTSATITMPDKDSEAYGSADEMQKYLQTQLNQAFGYNRVTVTMEPAKEGGGVTPTFSVDGNNTFSIDSGSLNLVGASGVFGIDRGASNRVNTSKTLGELYPDLFKDMTSSGTKDGKATYAFEINGVKIGDYTEDTTLATIMSDINDNTQAGVKVSYSKTSDQFVFTSTHGGAGGKIEIESDTTSGSEANLAVKLFGTVTYDEASNEVVSIKVGGTDEQLGAADSSVSHIRGQDATMTAYINGVETTLTSGTNTFNIDGFTVKANGTFKATNSNERVSFESKVDTDKIVDAIKSFVEDYNKVLEEINNQYTTRPDSKYQPLTDDQKSEMSEKQIEEYEAKAKEGILYNDRDLGSLSNALRFLFSNSKYSDIGINVSTSYSDKGKITLDETKLRSMLETDPEKVSSAFSDPLSYTSADGSTSSSVNSAESGVMALLKVQLDRYAGTTGATKGILIEKAGSQYSPLALLNNTIQDQIDSIDKVIDTLTDKLNDEIDYYTSKFSQLEVLIAQMNSQSSYLSSLGGGSY